MTIERNKHGNLVEFKVTEDCTVMKITLNTERGAVSIRSKGNDADEPWSDALKLSCDRLSRCGIKNFCEYAKSVIGLEIWNTIQQDVPHDDVSPV